LRDGGYVLPADAYVIRGGEMLHLDLRAAAVNCLKKYDVLGISVVAGDVPTVEDLARQGHRRLQAYGCIHICRMSDLDPRHLQPPAELQSPSFHAGHEIDRDQPHRSPQRVLHESGEPAVRGSRAVADGYLG
jgi:hypothetical protein